MNRNYFIYIGDLIAVIGCISIFFYTNKAPPGTTAKAIYDLISTIMVLTGMILQTIGHSLPKNND